MEPRELQEYRYRVVREVLDGSAISEVAVRYGTSRQSLDTWSKRFLAGGLPGLLDRSRRAAHQPGAHWLAEIDRLTGLGATVKERFEAHAWTRDPEGNDFCVVDGNHGGSGWQHGGEST